MKLFCNILRSKNAYYGSSRFAIAKKRETTGQNSLSVQEGVKSIEENFPQAVQSFVETKILELESNALNKTYEASETSTREAHILGTARPYKIVWVETYRTGRAVTIIDGKRYEVLFQFQTMALQTKRK